jgi:hypothetical protein
MAHPVLKVRDLVEFGQAGHQYSCERQKDKCRPSPDKTIDQTVDICDRLHNNYSFSPFEKTLSTKKAKISLDLPVKGHLCH